MTQIRSLKGAARDGATAPHSRRPAERREHHGKVSALIVQSVLILDDFREGYKTKT